MRSVERLESSLSEIVTAIKAVDGVMGIILFGSVARGEGDEGSDIDLLVVFEDEDKMREKEWEVTLRVPPNVFVQSICVCPSTLKRMNPVFLQSVLDEGIILFMRHPLVLRSHMANTNPHLIVTYSLAGLSQRGKQKVNYGLFGREIGERRYIGLIERHGGKRLGRGSFLIPVEDARPVLSFLDERDVRYETNEVYTPSKTPKFLR